MIYPLSVGDKVDIITQHGDYEKGIVLVCAILKDELRWKVDVMVEATGKIETIEFSTDDSYRTAAKP